MAGGRQLRVAKGILARTLAGRDLKADGWTLARAAGGRRTSVTAFIGRGGPEPPTCAVPGFRAEDEALDAAGGWPEGRAECSSEAGLG